MAPPDQVLVQFQASGQGNPPVMRVTREGRVAEDPAPVGIAVYWDYAPLTGQIAYSPSFFHPSPVGSRSVTSLHVFDYSTGQDAEWIADNVSRAAWSPGSGPGGALQLAVSLWNNESARYDLALVDTSGGVNFLVVLVEGASSHFSWSPDGEQIAYVGSDAAPTLPPSDADLFLLTLETGEVRRVGPYPAYGTGWTGDKPIWLDERALLTPARSQEGLFRITLLDGTETFVPAFTPVEESQTAPLGEMLWSPPNQQVVVEQTTLTETVVWAYTLSEDLRAVTESYRIGESDLLLLGWLDEGESVVVLDPVADETHIWSLGERAFVEAP